MHLCRWLTILILLASISASAFSQNVYKKKVVSYVPTVLVARGCGLQSEQVEYVSSEIGNEIQMPRFNFVALPSMVIKDFASVTSDLGTVSAENVRPLAERTLAADMLKVLDINKELLSKQNLSEAERNTFLATKAQAAGLTAEELRAVLNSAFLYIPYVRYYHHSITHGADTLRDEKGKIIEVKKYRIYRHEIEVGTLWYKLNVSQSNDATISFLAVANGWGDCPIVSEARQYEGEKGDADESAFDEAVKTSARSIAFATREINEFRLTGEVEELTTFGLKFNLGTREGVGLDDSYWVDEMQQTSSGALVEVKRGFVKVRDVGNNASDRTAKTYAQVITGTNYSEGLSVKEIPLMGVNTILGVGKIPVEISRFDNYQEGYGTGFGLSKHNYAIRINSKTDQAYGPMLDFQTDLANGTGVPELWFNLGGALGVTNVDGHFYLLQYGSIDSSADVGVSLTWYLHAGLLKKFYFRRFGLLFQGDVKYAFTNFWANGKAIDGDTVDIAMRHAGLGFDGRVGVEIYLTPTSAIGVAAEYSYVPSSNKWTVWAGNTKNDSAIGPDVKHIGIGFYLWINRYF